MDDGGRCVLDKGRDLAHAVPWWFSGDAALAFGILPGGGGGGIPAVVPGRARGHAEGEWACLLSTSLMAGMSDTCTAGVLVCGGRVITQELW